jgi:hypothetical protein
MPGVSRFGGSPCAKAHATRTDYKSGAIQTKPAFAGVSESPRSRSVPKERRTSLRDAIRERLCSRDFQSPGVSSKKGLEQS